MVAGLAGVIGETTLQLHCGGRACWSDKGNNSTAMYIVVAGLAGVIGETTLQLHCGSSNEMPQGLPWCFFQRQVCRDMFAMK